MAEEGQAATQPYVSPQQQLHQAALRILDSEEPQAQTEEAKPEETPEAAEVKAEEPPPEKTSEEVKAEIRRLKLKYNGEEIEKEEPEVIELAQKGFDYTKKTMDLAKEREEFRQKSKQELDTKVKEYDDKLALAEQAIWQTLMPEIQSIDWNKLASENPSEWATKYQYVQNVNARLAQIQAERGKIAQQKQAEQQETFKKQVSEAQEILTKAIPGWNNDLYGKILKTGTEYGFKSEEVNAITDPRAIQVLHDAMQFRALKTAKPAVDKKVASVPKVAKPGTAEKPDPNAEKWNKGMAKLQQSGGRDMRTAAELAKSFLTDVK